MFRKTKNKRKHKIVWQVAHKHQSFKTNSVINSIITKVYYTIRLCKLKKKPSISFVFRKKRKRKQMKRKQCVADCSQTSIFWNNFFVENVVHNILKLITRKLSKTKDFHTHVPGPKRKAGSSRAHNTSPFFRGVRTSSFSMFNDNWIELRSKYNFKWRILLWMAVQKNIDTHVHKARAFQTVHADKMFIIIIIIIMITSVSHFHTSFGDLDLILRSQGSRKSKTDVICIGKFIRYWFQNCMVVAQIVTIANRISFRAAAKNVRMAFSRRLFI